MDYLTYVKTHLTIDFLAPQHQEVAEIIGMESYIKLCDTLGGTEIYVPTMKKIFMNYISQKVRESKDLFTPTQLARMYGISVGSVYKILSKDRKK